VKTIMALLYITILFTIFVTVAAILTIPFAYLWDYFVPELFGVKELSIVNAFLLLTLIYYPIALWQIMVAVSVATAKKDEQISNSFKP